MKHLLVLDNPKEWPLLTPPDTEIILARDYLTRDDYRHQHHVKIYNLCKSYRYQSAGYYVSLLAAARGHKAIPSVTTIQDLKTPSLARAVTDQFSELIQRSLEGVAAEEFTLNIYFGHSVVKRYARLSAKLFDLFQAPLLRVHFQRSATGWQLQSLKPLSALEIPEPHYSCVEEFARDCFRGRKSATRPATVYSYDLAILVNPTERLPPSDARALRYFSQAASELGLASELITRDDLGRIAEFDALFIRETTFVNHHTYRFSRRAQAEGLVVIDDPDSILKCTNKIYLAEFLEGHKVRMPRSVILHRDNLKDVPARIGFPCILKQPDSAFSQGVVKASNWDELVTLMDRLSAKSDLLIAQEFLPTDFDWRIGVLDGKPLFACRYYMARDHWQIMKRVGNDRKHLDGRVQAFDLSAVPEDVVRSAVQAARLIGDGLYGVDLKEIDGKCYVIEVNDNPNIDAGYEDAVSKRNLYFSVMRTFRDRIEKRKQWVST